MRTEHLVQLRTLLNPLLLLGALHCFEDEVVHEEEFGLSQGPEGVVAEEHLEGDEAEGEDVGLVGELEAEE